MIVCLCAGTSDRTIRKLVQDGASTVRDVSVASDGAGTHCGSCCCDIARLVKKQPETETSGAGAEPPQLVLRR